MEQELETKFDIPLKHTSEEVVGILDIFASGTGMKVKKWVATRQFTYFDDPCLPLLRDGATFRIVSADKVGEYWSRFDFKQGAVGTKNRVEASEASPQGIQKPILYFVERWKIGLRDPQAVASVWTIHEKWELTGDEEKVEISYDRFFSDRERTQLLFQEVEVEDKSMWGRGEKGWKRVVASLKKHLTPLLQLTHVNVQKYERVMQTLHSARALLAVIAYAFTAHNDQPTLPRKARRRHDKMTPAAVHPCWGAMTILQEPLLPWRLRWNGAMALALHDVLEDTTAGLPEGTSEVVAKLVGEMTFKSYGEELDSWWKLSSEAKLLKLYDKVSNLLDGSWMPPEKLVLYRCYTLQLSDEAAKQYGELNIVKIARAICA